MISSAYLRLLTFLQANFSPGWVIFHHIYVPNLLCPFLYWWTFRSLPCPGYCKQHCNKQLGCVFSNQGFRLRVYLLTASPLVFMLSILTLKYAVSHSFNHFISCTWVDLARDVKGAHLPRNVLCPASSKARVLLLTSLSWPLVWGPGWHQLCPKASRWVSEATAQLAATLPLPFLSSLAPATHTVFQMRPTGLLFPKKRVSVYLSISAFVFVFRFSSFFYCLFPPSLTLLPEPLALSLASSSLSCRCVSSLLFIGTKPPRPLGFCLCRDRGFHRVDQWALCALLSDMSVNIKPDFLLNSSDIEQSALKVPISKCVWGHQFFFPFGQKLWPWKFLPWTVNWAVVSMYGGFSWAWECVGLENRWVVSSSSLVCQKL